MNKTSQKIAINQLFFNIYFPIYSLELLIHSVKGNSVCK